MKTSAIFAKFSGESSWGYDRHSSRGWLATGFAYVPKRPLIRLDGFI